MNELIEEIFANFTVDGVAVPVAFLRYDGKSTTYVVYQQTDKANSLSGDNELIGYIDYYDFNVYSTGNYFPVVEKIKEKMLENGFTWQPSRDSGDMYENDTEYYHKTVCFAIEREV